MEKKYIEEINFLAKKQREGTLTEEEKERQAYLRKMYLESVRKNLKTQLDSIVIDDGGKKPVQ